ncbi:Tyrosine-tRNA ligase, bacterial-type, type 1 [Phytophthora cactorum]|nr:Tyrosine-tRNA ligase, bacterial-type, type 1 [Phytophthora cactorum]
MTTRALLLSLVLAVWAPLGSAMHVTIPSGASECFSVEAESFKHGISLNFEVLRGVADELETELTDGKDQVVYARKGASGRYVSPIREGGMHSVCFKNERSPVGDVVIGFSFHADDPSHECCPTQTPPRSELEDIVYELSVNLDTVKDTQAFMKAITNHHNQLITSTHNRVMWWTLVEMFVLTAVSMAQISFLRRTLEVRRILALAALGQRGMLAALTHQEAGTSIDKLLLSSRAPAVYCGFDPTADSLHLGNLLQGIALRHFQRAGVRPILLVGGATGMIGDPSGKSEERVLLSDDTVLHNAQEIAKGLSAVLDFDDPKTGAIICNNAEWHTKMSAVTWMRDIGRHFRVNAMLQRESVKKRLETDQGISFLEFSYQLFQAYDFLHLYKNYGCVAQIGGSDQWGNIASGIELVRKSTGEEVFGATLALLTTASGEKYGKSAGNAIWLDAEKTSVFDFYQFFLRSDDRDVEKLLKSFTFREVEDIRDIVAEHEKAPEKRAAQKVLAEEITVMMHGQEGLKAALDATELLFGKKSGPLTAEEMLCMAGDAPMTVLSRADVIDQSLVDLAVRLGAASQKVRVLSCPKRIKEI